MNVTRHADEPSPVDVDNDGFAQFLVLVVKKLVIAVYSHFCVSVVGLRINVFCDIEGFLNKRCEGKGRRLAY